MPLSAWACSAVTPWYSNTLYGTQPAYEPGGHPSRAASMRSIRKSLTLSSVDWLRPYSTDALYDQKSLIAPSAPATKRKFEDSISEMRGPPSTLRLPTYTVSGAFGSMITSASVVSFTVIGSPFACSEAP